jgi:hypothetical protein
LFYYIVQRKSINGTCPGTYACDRYTPLVCFAGLCVWFVIVLKVFIFFVRFSLVQHQLHGLAQIVHVLAVKHGLAVPVSSSDNDTYSYIKDYMITDLILFSSFSALISSDKRTNVSFFVKQKKAENLIQVIEKILKEKKRKNLMIRCQFFFLVIYTIERLRQLQNGRERQRKK